MRPIHASEVDGDDMLPHGEKYNRAKKEASRESPPKFARLQNIFEIFERNPEVFDEATRAVLLTDTTVAVDLLQANKQIYAEASEIFYGKNRFFLHMENVRPHGPFPNALIEQNQLALMKDLKLELPWRGFEHYTSSVSRSGNVAAIEVLVDAWMNRIGIKNLEVEIRPEYEDCSHPQFTVIFQSSMAFFQRVRNAKSVSMSFNLDELNPISLEDDVFQVFPTWTQGLQTLKRDLALPWKKETKFLTALVEQMKALSAEPQAEMTG